MAKKAQVGLKDKDQVKALLKHFGACRTRSKTVLKDFTTPRAAYQKATFDDIYWVLNEVGVDLPCGEDYEYMPKDLAKRARAVVKRLDKAHDMILKLEEPLGVAEGDLSDKLDINLYEEAFTKTAEWAKLQAEYGNKIRAKLPWTEFKALVEDALAIQTERANLTF